MNRPYDQDALAAPPGPPLVPDDEMTLTRQHLRDIAALGAVLVLGFLVAFTAGYLFGHFVLT